MNGFRISAGTVKRLTLQQLRSGSTESEPGVQVIFCSVFQRCFVSVL